MYIKNKKQIILICNFWLLNKNQKKNQKNNYFQCEISNFSINHIKFDLSSKYSQKKNTFFHNILLNDYMSTLTLLK